MNKEIVTEYLSLIGKFFHGEAMTDEEILRMGKIDEYFAKNWQKRNQYHLGYQKMYQDKFNGGGGI